MKTILLHNHKIKAILMDFFLLCCDIVIFAFKNHVFVFVDCVILRRISLLIVMPCGGEAVQSCSKHDVFCDITMYCNYADIYGSILTF